MRVKPNLNTVPRMTWSERFAKFVRERFDGNQLEVAFSLRVAPSRIHDWMHGTTPRAETRRRIQKWSGGRVEDIPAPADSSERPLAKTAARPRRKAEAS